MGYHRGGNADAAAAAHEELKIETPYGVIWVTTGAQPDPDPGASPVERLIVSVRADETRFGSKRPPVVPRVDDFRPSIASIVVHRPMAKPDGDVTNAS